MHIICSWCRKEGQIGLVGEKDPLEDRRETHGICLAHYETARIEWRAASRALARTDVPRAPIETEVRGVVIDARERFRLSPARWWSGLKHLVRKAAGV